MGRHVTVNAVEQDILKLGTRVSKLSSADLSELIKRMQALPALDNGKFSPLEFSKQLVSLGLTNYPKEG